MQMITIRKLGVDDAAAFLATRQRALRDHPDVYTSTAEEWDVPVSHAVERIQRNIVFGGFVDDTLAGVVTLSLTARRATKQRHKAEIWSVYVAPEHRGLGIARAMMVQTIAEAKLLGFFSVMLSVADGNVVALKLYESMGFLRYGTEPRAIRLPENGQFIDNHFMQLDLIEP
jgi:ribosomal protein S18 acetylase RimI-like enzyme